MAHHPILSKFLASVFLLFLSINYTNGQVQSITLYKTSTCTEDQLLGTFIRNGTLNVTSSDKVESLKLAGLWQIDMCPDDSKPCVSTILYNDQPSCNAQQPAFSNGTVTLTRFGTSSMRENSVFVLYEDSNFMGTQHQLTNQTDVDLVLNSYWFSGAESSWLIYSGPNYTGNATCLGPTNTIKSSGWGFTYSLRDYTFNLRSIKPTAACPVSSSSVFGLSFNILFTCLLMLTAKM